MYEMILIRPGKAPLTRKQHLNRVGRWRRGQMKKRSGGKNRGHLAWQRVCVQVGGRTGSLGWLVLPPFLLESFQGLWLSPLVVTCPNTVISVQDSTCSLILPSPTLTDICGQVTWSTVLLEETGHQSATKDCQITGQVSHLSPGHNGMKQQTTNNNHFIILMFLWIKNSGRAQWGWFLCTPPMLGASGGDSRGWLQYLEMAGTDALGPHFWVPDFAYS